MSIARQDPDVLAYLPANLRGHSVVPGVGFGVADWQVGQLRMGGMKRAVCIDALTRRSGRREVDLLNTQVVAALDMQVTHIHDQVAHHLPLNIQGKLIDNLVLPILSDTANNRAILKYEITLRIVVGTTDW